MLSVSSELISHVCKYIVIFIIIVIIINVSKVSSPKNFSFEARSVPGENTSTPNTTDEGLLARSVTAITCPLFCIIQTWKSRSFNFSGTFGQPLVSPPAA